MNKKENLRIVLVNPPSPFLINEKVFPPLGLLTISSYIKSAGYKNITFLDLAGRKEIPEIEGDIFFFTATTPQVENAKDIMRKLRFRNKTARMVIGGPHATVKYDDLLSFDSVVQGEGEINTLKILDQYPNLKKIYLEDRIENLDNVLFPDRDIINIKEYAKNYTLDGKQTTTYITSRGCSYGKCAFCCRMQKGVRYRSAKNIYEEVKMVKEKYGINGAMFFDDEFVSNKKRLKEFCRLIKPLKISWRCLARVSSIDEKIVPIMRSAGCTEIALGIESADQDILKTVAKGTKVDKAKKAVRIIQRNDIKVKELFIIGLPGENEKSIEKVDKFVRSTKPDDVDFTVLSVYPGSAIYEKPHRYDINFNPKCKANYKGIPGQYGHICKISTSSLTFEQIVESRDKLEQKYKCDKQLISK